MAVTDRLAPTASRAVFWGDILIGGCLAALTSAHSILILCYSLVGSSGNTVFTGALLTSVLVAILTLNFRPDITLGTADYLFASFLFCVVASFAINGRTATPKEWDIFSVSLAAYPVCRSVSLSRLREAARLSFNWVTGIVVALGAIITAQVLFAQWYDKHGKPIVFGFDAAAPLFLTSLGFLLIALSTRPLTNRSTAIISASIFLPSVIFAASQVRFTFIAIVCSLFLAAILSGVKQRKHVAIIALVMMTGIFAGLVARFRPTVTLLSYAVEEVHEKKISIPDGPSVSTETHEKLIGNSDTLHSSAQPEPAPAPAIIKIKPPSCNLAVNMNNSIAERKALWEDALYLIPLAGGFGFGLDGFLTLTCMPFSVHNSALQALIEFGWFGGSALVLLVAVSLLKLLPAARHDDTIKFVLCSLAYIVAMSLAHGRTSRDILLFALLGLSAGVFETYKKY
jgi:hypothetical protein